MANTYQQMFVHVVFGVRFRQKLIHEKIRGDVEKYISRLILKRKCKVMSIYCMPDHIHLLISLHPDISLSNLVKDIKTGSSHLINSTLILKSGFKWQGGYGAFSVSKSIVPKVARYISNQPKHHDKVRYKEEYLEILRAEGVSFHPNYVFKDVLGQ